MLAEAQIQLALRHIRRQLPDQIAFGSESLKPLQFGFKVGHDAPPLMAIKGTRLRLQFTSQLTSLSDRTNLQPRRYAGQSRNHCLLMRQRTSPLQPLVKARWCRPTSRDHSAGPANSKRLPSGSLTMKSLAPHGSRLSVRKNVAPAAWNSRKSSSISSALATVSEAESNSSRSRKTGSITDCSTHRKFSRAPSRATCA